MLHSDLIGTDGARERLNTPALIVDIAAFERNVARMAGFIRNAGLTMRPHAKTHKSADVARAQVAAGAVGICCAKLGEAEALAAAGIADIHLTSPVVTPMAIARLAALNGRMRGLSVVVDHLDPLEALAKACEDGPPMTVLIDVDPGGARTGVTSAATALALALRIAELPALHFAGVQFYYGPLQHVENFAERKAAILDQCKLLRDVLDTLSAAGIAVPTVTGGGTGSHAIDVGLGLFTELQVGSYIFMDRQYIDCDLDGSGVVPFETALMVDASVVSANVPSQVTIDAGLKSFSTDAGLPVILAGAPAGSTYRFKGDEHGAILFPDGAEPLPLGARVTLEAPHCDPTVNLYDVYHVMRGEVLEAIWPVTARGRSA